ncbi:MAG: hypothetical protein PHO01_13275, partial [Desulfotomaculaceae bacterium]|nr:hypothetical protein [Desulfotomaculaceae bacterium]
IEPIQRYPERISDRLGYVFRVPVPNGRVWSDPNNFVPWINYLKPVAQLQSERFLFIPFDINI